MPFGGGGEYAGDLSVEVVRDTLVRLASRVVKVGLSWIAAPLTTALFVATGDVWGEECEVIVV